MTKRRIHIRSGPAARPMPELDDVLQKHLVLAPEAIWRVWIQEIAKDPDMSVDRVLRHLQAHVGQHMPNNDGNKARWEDWIAGTHNLLAILSCMLGTDPPHDVGVQCLLKKWTTKPHDHTPPPIKPTVLDKFAEELNRKARRRAEREEQHYSS